MQDILQRLIAVVKNPSDFEDIIQVAKEAEKFLDVCAKLPKPLLGLVIIKPLIIEQKKGIFEVGVNEKLHYGVVIKRGEKVHPEVKEGDRLVWFEETGEEMEFEGETFLVMNLPEKVLIL